jgi:hypothetical protein
VEEVEVPKRTLMMIWLMNDHPENNRKILRH